MLSSDIESLWAIRDDLPAEAEHVVMSVLAALRTGSVSVVEQQEGQWVVHEWVKQAIILAFRCLPMQVMPGQVFDRIPLLHRSYTEADFRRDRIRVTPGAVIREGVYLAPQCVVMMSFVNSGAHIGVGAMIDTMSTIGSCAYIGDRVHISAQVCIGGVLEPLQARPVIIEEGAFIGAGAQILEGVLVGAGAIVSSGVRLTQSTKIYDASSGTVSYGMIPPGAVVIPGSLPRDNGRYAVSCAVITKIVDAELRAKLSVNELLRQH